MLSFSVQDGPTDWLDRNNVNLVEPWMRETAEKRKRGEKFLVSLMLLYEIGIILSIQVALSSTTLFMRNRAHTRTAEKQSWNERAKKKIESITWNGMDMVSERERIPSRLQCQASVQRPAKAIQELWRDVSNGLGTPEIMWLHLWQSLSCYPLFFLPISLAWEMVI